jgi:hypothetical protein
LAVPARGEWREEQHILALPSTSVRDVPATLQMLVPPIPPLARPQRLPTATAERAEDVLSTEQRVAVRHRGAGGACDAVVLQLLHPYRQGQNEGKEAQRERTEVPHDRRTVEVAAWFHVEALPALRGLLSRG